MELNNIDFNKLRVFHAVVQRGNYALASERLNLTRSAISQAVTTLETQLGFKLFLRRSRKLIPTREALSIFDEVDRCQSRLTQLLTQKSSSEIAEGMVRIGAFPEFGKAHLLPLIKSFLSKHPLAQVKFQFDSPTQLRRLLEKNSVDMSFSIFPFSDLKGMECVPVLKEELVLIGAPKILGKAKNLADLLTLPMIDYFPSHCVMQRWIYQHFRKKPKRLPIVLYAATAEMVLEAVRCGLGVGVVPSYLLPKNQKKHSLKVLRPSTSPLIDYIWLNQFQGQFSNSAHKMLYRQFVQSMGQSSTR